MKELQDRSANCKYRFFSIIILNLMLNLAMTSLCAAQGKDTISKGSDHFCERLNLRTDRDLYAAGEKVWFSVYKFNSITSLPDKLSKVVYADLLDLENNPLVHLKIEMNGWTGSGSFSLPDTIRTGNYLICSYTNWMKNFSPDLFAFKSISVINTFESISSARLPGKIQLPDSIAFYPEGGKIIAGNPSRLGLRTFGKKGTPVQSACVITGENSDTLCRITTGPNGYSLATFIPPSPGKLSLIAASGSRTKRFALPPVLDDAMLLVSDTASAKHGSLARLITGKRFEREGKTYKVKIYAEGLPPIEKIIKGDRIESFALSGEDVPKGLLYILITDPNGSQLTERWIFNAPENSLKLRLEELSGSYDPREKIKLGIVAEDASGLPVRSRLSVSVAKAAAANTLKSHPAFPVQLPGYDPVARDCGISDINEILIFFHPVNSKYPGEKANGSQWPAYLPETEGLLISGSIRDRATEEPLKNENLTLSIVGKTALCNFARTDSSGNFNFVIKERGLREIVIQPLTLRKECYIDLTNSITPKPGDYYHGIFIPDTSRLKEINNILISMQVSNIYEPFFRKKASVEVLPPARNFYGKPDNSVDMSKYIQLTSVREIVTELMPGVSATRSGGRLNFRMNKPDQTKPFENPPLVLVDGIPVYDLDKVVSISSNDIERVDVLINRYFIFGNVLDGIIHFITRKGNLSAMETDKSIFRMEYDLLKKPELFTVPDYSQDTVKSSTLPDFRNTLYWNPSIETGADGKGSAEFYSSDEAGAYVINIEGYTEKGNYGQLSVPVTIRPFPKK